MSYVAKGEKVFDWQSLDCTPPLRRSDHRLKRFSSTFDKRAWHQCDDIRYRHLYDLMSGSQTCLNIDQSHKYIPLDDLIKIIMFEKDELIKQLQEQLKRCNQSQDVSSSSKDKASFPNRIAGMGGNETKELLTKREGGATYDKDQKSLEKGVVDTSENEAEELQNRVVGLTEELNKSRNMLRQAMQKLQNIDEIVNENKKLQCRLRCSEERIKYLEEKKRRLESELADLRSKSQIQIDLEKAQQMLSSVTQRQEESAEMDEVVLQNLTLERDELQDKVKKLEKELQESKKKETEIEILKKQSQSDSLDKEEMSRENECYRKKLASMKCLEKQIQELKKQGRALADKYKREAQKAAEQMSRMDQAAKELQTLRNERDSLRKRVNELASYESQYNSLQRKLQQVDAVIAENESLNSKLLALQNLEKENEYLRCRLEAIKEVETTATEDKERIMQLQCAVAEQEEEMKDLLCQIERLTSGKHEEELERLKCELYEKNSKLKLCEEQLAEIPMLEAEIDELRLKLQCYCRGSLDRKTGENSRQKIEVRLPATSKGIRANYKNPKEKCSSLLGIRREERVEIKNLSHDCQNIIQEQKAKAKNLCSEFSEMKDKMSCEEVQSLLQSSKGIISCVLEDMIEHQKEMEELERCNKAMKEEINALKEKVGSSDRDVLLHEINKLKQCLRNKDMEILKLQSAGPNAQNSENIETLRQLNEEMKCELEGAESSGSSKTQDDPSGFKSKTETSSPGLTEESFTVESDYLKALQRETNDLKLQIQALNKLTNELKKENELLRELQKPGPDFSKQLDEKCALENLISLLQAELDSFKEQKLSNECEALRNELKRVMELNCDLKTLVNCYRQRLNLEKKSFELKNEARSSVSGEADRLKGETIKQEGTLGGENLRNFDGTQMPNEIGKAKLEREVLKGTKLESDMPGSATSGSEKPSTGVPRTAGQGKGEAESDVSGSGIQGSPTAGSGAQKGPTPGSATPGSGAQGIIESETSDCFKELERLRKEKNDLLKQLEAKNSAQDDVSKLQEKLRQMEAENADKLKKLMDQHKKELADREKTYNENLNSMKYGYETGIRKLSERHKQSVVRLQELHQDEIQEINSNYEAQLDTMQTQSEAAINDIAQNSAAKIRKLVAKHSKEMGELRDSLMKNAKELDTIKKEEKDSSEKDLNSQMKIEQARLMQKMRRTSQQKISAMKMKFEESKLKFEEETEDLKKKLKEQIKGNGVCECSFAKKKLRKPRDPSCPLDFNEVLEKILEEGLDSLTFNEIALVHRKTCCALEGIVMKSNSNPMLELEPPVNDGCPHTPLLEADKQQLLNRIFALENEIVQKQKQTQDAIISMEVAIKKERCRLQELRNSLESEQQKNSVLKLFLSNQTKAQSDLKRERDRLGNEASMHQMLCQERTKQLDEEIKTKKCLEMEIAKLKADVKHLCAALDAERGKCFPIQRNHVEHSVRQDRRLQSHLKNETKGKMQEVPVQGQKHSLKHMVKLPAMENDIGFSQNPLEVKSAKERQNLDQIREKKHKMKTKNKKKK